MVCRAIVRYTVYRIGVLSLEITFNSTLCFTRTCMLCLLLRGGVVLHVFISIHVYVHFYVHVYIHVYTCLKSVSAFSFLARRIMEQSLHVCLLYLYHKVHILSPCLPSWCVNITFYVYIHWVQITQWWIQPDKRPQVPPHNLQTGIRWTRVCGLANFTRRSQLKNRGRGYWETATRCWSIQTR